MKGCSARDYAAWASSKRATTEAWSKRASKQSACLCQAADGAHGAFSPSRSQQPAAAKPSPSLSKAALLDKLRSLLQRKRAERAAALLREALAMHSKFCAQDDRIRGRWLLAATCYSSASFAQTDLNLRARNPHMTESSIGQVSEALP